MNKNTKHQHSLKNLILFSLVSEQELFKDDLELEYYDYDYLYDRLAQYKHSSIRDAVLQLVDKGQVNKLKQDARVYFRLNNRGKHQLMGLFPSYKTRKKIWDRKWRIAIIRGKSRLKKPENRTERITNLSELRHKLRENGFKKYIRGVYIQPFTITEKVREFLLNEKFTPLLTVIESSSLIVGDHQQLAMQIWNLQNLMNRYQQFIKRVDRLIIKINNKKVLKNKDKLEFSLILQEMFTLLKIDPGLPKKLLMSRWPAKKSRTKFLELTKLINKI